MVEKFTILEILRDYKYVILGLIMMAFAFLIWSEEEPSFSISIGILGFLLLMWNLK